MTPASTRQPKSRQSNRKRPALRMLSRAQVPSAVQTMAAPSGTARFDAGKALVATARKDPMRVYPHFDDIAALLGCDSKVVCWNAMQIVAALAPADVERRIDAILDAYLSLVSCGNLVSAVNAIDGAGRIVACRPDLLERILPAMLAVPRAAFKTAECRNVAIGAVLDALEALGARVCQREDAASFIRRQQTNPRAAVAKHATKMIASLPRSA